MEQRDLGKSGLKISALGFGCGSVGGLMVRGDPVEQKRAVGQAIEAGITYFDTAASYGDGRSEENLGRTLRELSALNRVAVGTKIRLTVADLVDPTASIRRAFQQGLQRLGMDSVNRLQLHGRIALEQPASDSALGLEHVIGDVAEGFKTMVKEGLVRQIGFTGLGDTVALREVALSGDFDSVQCYFNALNPSAGFSGYSGGGQDFDGLINTAAAAGLSVLVIRALAAGALTADPLRHPVAGRTGGVLVKGNEYDADVERAHFLAPLSQELGLEGPLELGLRFALSKPGVSSVLVGFSDQAQLESALRWAERGPLPEDAIRRIVEIAA
jgi:L-galactose dehydrogenase/L-glyceraldehyde 3-phosphate reductase